MQEENVNPIVKDDFWIGGTGRKRTNYYEVVEYEGEDDYFWLFWVVPVSFVVDGETTFIENGSRRLWTYRKKKPDNIDARGRTEYTELEPPPFYEEMKQRKEAQTEQSKLDKRTKFREMLAERGIGETEPAEEA